MLRLRKCVHFPAEFLKDLFGEGKYANAVVVELLSDPEGSNTCRSASLYMYINTCVPSLLQDLKVLSQMSYLLLE